MAHKIPTGNLTGRTFGRLTVTGTDSTTYLRTTRWNCRCECGNVCSVPAASLLDGLTKSCGCLRREIYGDHSPANISPSAPRSGFLGVREKNDRWNANITVDGLTFDLDTYPTKEEAVAVRQEAEQHRTNFAPWYCDWLMRRTETRLQQKLNFRKENTND